MRIVSGKYRGKKLSAPKGKNVRPTAERAREALFSILYSRLGSFAGLKVLDVFAGTGAFGLEALSRGAARAVFVDRDIRLLNKNMALFPAEKDKIGVISADAAMLPPAPESFNLVFMDAPYGKGLSVPAAESLVRGGWLEDGALLAVETGAAESLDLPGCMTLADERRYGAAKVRFFVYKK